MRVYVYVCECVSNCEPCDHLKQWLKPFFHFYFIFSIYGHPCALHRTPVFFFFNVPLFCFSCLGCIPEDITKWAGNILLAVGCRERARAWMLPHGALFCVSDSDLPRTSRAAESGLGMRDWQVVFSADWQRVAEWRNGYNLLLAHRTFDFLSFKKKKKKIVFTSVSWLVENRLLDSPTCCEAMEHVFIRIFQMAACAQSVWKNIWYPKSFNISRRLGPLIVSYRG